ncbi:MAG TPA: DivIVA domain-containing protein [Atopostipes sp.]|nr:DivIVA domain-containing protein [Atopostipes sp.]
MALTPLDIHNREFKKAMRGYDQDEVNEFLDEIIRDYEMMIRENKEKSSSLELANKKLANYEEMQDSLNKSILVAQDAADRLRENTDREIEVIQREAESYAEEKRQEADKYAEEIRKEADNYYAETSKKADEYADRIHFEAENNADELLNEAVNKARKIEDETEALRKQSRVFRQRLQLLIESQLDLLTKEDWENLLVGKPIEYPSTVTIEEVEKELGEKIVEEVEVVDANAAYDEAEDNAYEEEEEFAIADEEVYNNEDSKNEEQLEEEEYEEGTMPAIELPDSKDN